MLADDHQELLYLLECLIGYILNSRNVGIDDNGDGFTQSGRKILQGFTVEGVVTVGEVCFEEWGHLDVSDDVHRFLDMVLQNIIQRDCCSLEDAFQLQIFAEGKAIHGVSGLATGHIHSCIVKDQQGAAGIDNAHIGVVIIDVFQSLRPSFVTMYFIQIKPGNAVPVRPVDEIHQAVCGKP